MFYVLLTPFIDFLESRVSFVKASSVTFTSVLVRLVARASPTLCDPMDCSPPGSSVHGILQAIMQEWDPPPGDLPNPGIEPRSPTVWEDSLPTEPLGKSSYLRHIHLSETLKYLLVTKIPQLLLQRSRAY